MKLIRETCPDQPRSGYRVYDNGAGSIIIEAKERGTIHPRKSLYLKREWDALIWRQLQELTEDTSFNGSCCLELGIGAFKKK